MKVGLRAVFQRAEERENIEKRVILSINLVCACNPPLSADNLEVRPGLMRLYRGRSLNRHVLLSGRSLGSLELKRLQQANDASARQLAVFDPDDFSIDEYPVVTPAPIDTQVKVVIPWGGVSECMTRRLLNRLLKYARRKKSRAWEELL